MYSLGLVVYVTKHFRGRPGRGKAVSNPTKVRPRINDNRNNNNGRFTLALMAFFVHVIV